MDAHGIGNGHSKLYNIRKAAPAAAPVVVVVVADDASKQKTNERCQSESLSVFLRFEAFCLDQSSSLESSL